jgi:hypothetical protein
LIDGNNYDYYGEITNAKEYNVKYCVNLDKRDISRRKRKGVVHPNEMDKFWDSMSEHDKNRWAESYMDFLEYYRLHCKTGKYYILR